MTVDDITIHRWIADALEVMRDRDPATKAPDDTAVLSERAKELKKRVIALLERGALDAAGRMAAQAVLRAIEEMGAAWQEAPPQKSSLRSELEKLAAQSRRASWSSSLRPRQEMQSAIPRSQVHVGPVKPRVTPPPTRRVWGREELAEKKAARHFREGLEELIRRRRRRP